jgi:hypothetical protein
MAEWFDYGQERKERDLAGIQDPFSWPCYPILPLKRYRADRQGGPELGLLKANGGFGAKVEPVVYLTTMFSPNADCKTLEYGSLTELLNDGWTVD